MATSAGWTVRKLHAVGWSTVTFKTTAVGPMVIALIGALNVSSITTDWLGEIPSGEQRLWRENGSPQRRYGRGEEIARFNLGSTVVLLLPAATLKWDAGLSAPRTLRVGEALGSHSGGV